MQLRAVLIQLSDQLSDTDRKALHFYIGPYVSRNDRDDCTSNGTLRLFEILFDRCVVSDDNVDYLIRGFERIRCTDAAEKLKMYKQRIIGSLAAEDTPSGLSCLESFFIDATDDKLVTVPLVTGSAPQEGPPPSAPSRPTHHELVCPSVQFHTIASSNGTVSLTENPDLKKPLCIQRRIAYLLAVAMMMVLVGFCAFFLRSKFTSKPPIPYNQSSSGLKQKSIYILKEGAQHGHSNSVQNQSFNDAKDLRLSYMDRCIGVQLQSSSGSLSIVRFLYSNKRPDTRFGVTADASASFMLNVDEEISKINLYQSVDPMDSKIIGIRFYTTDGRRSALFGSDDGRLRTESFEFYSFGYAKGRQEMETGIDMLQFIWIKKASLKDSMGTVSRSLVETCQFTFTSRITLRDVRARGAEASWADLKVEFNRTGLHCHPEALYYRTISEQGPKLFAIVGNHSVYYHEEPVWEKYRSARDIECSLVPQLN